MPELRPTQRSLLVACLLLSPTLAQAQQDQQDQQGGDAAEGRSTEFRAVEGATEEDVPGGPLLVGAYAVILALLVLYVLRLSGLQRRLAGDLGRLERTLAAGGDAADR
ncbi:MAG: hypothetical protein OEZ06_09300 [Myxococcales bacterium]|nr:hypothetical protein [Myxococcales bacterium]